MASLFSKNTNRNDELLQDKNITQNMGGIKGSNMMKSMSNFEHFYFASLYILIKDISNFHELINAMKFTKYHQSVRIM